jgi:hypothetical protein
LLSNVLRIIPQNFLSFDEICGEKAAEKQVGRHKKQKDKKGKSKSRKAYS